MRTKVYGNLICILVLSSRCFHQGQYTRADVVINRFLATLRSTSKFDAVTTICSVRKRLGEYANTIRPVKQAKAQRIVTSFCLAFSIKLKLILGEIEHFLLILHRVKGRLF